MNSQTPYEFTNIQEFTDILQMFRHPTNSQASYEFKDILRIHRHPANSQTSYEFTDILRIHKHPTNSQTPYIYIYMTSVQNSMKAVATILLRTGLTAPGQRKTRKQTDGSVDFPEAFPEAAPEATGSKSRCQQKTRKQKYGSVDFPEAFPKAFPKATCPVVAVSWTNSAKHELGLRSGTCPLRVAWSRRPCLACSCLAFACLACLLRVRRIVLPPLCQLCLLCSMFRSDCADRRFSKTFRPKTGSKPEANRKRFEHKLAPGHRGSI